MANEIRYSLTTSADRRTAEPTLYVCVAYKGSSKGRKYFTIKGLTAPDFRYWDKTIQRFSSGTDTAKANNPVLEDICTLCDELLANSAITSPSEFIDALKRGVAPSDVLTLGDFLRELIDDMRNGKNNKRPSKNYQCYITLLHKLEKEEKAQYKGKVLDLINVPIAEVDNKCFIQFGDFILSLSDKEGKSNYINLMKLFKQVHTKAYDRELTDTVLRYKYKDNAPLLFDEDAEKLPSLTVEQYAKFVALDVKTFPKSGALTHELMLMYKDFCIFLYETKTRPVDVMRAHTNNIITENGIKFLRYVPEKKKNNKQTDKNKIVNTRLSNVALAIIEKYNGKSKQGYIFPFSMNEYKWDMMDAKSWNKWNNRKQTAQEQINSWLRNKVAKAIGVDFRLTLYTFRHSTLTHACMSKSANWGAIALESGTSIKMLEQHYVSNTIAI